MRAGSDELVEDLFKKLKINNIPSIEKNKIIKEACIGEGSYGKVYKGKYEGKEVAIKKLKLSERAMVDEIINEIKVVSRLNFPRTPNFFGVWQNEKNIPCLVFDFIKGITLKKWIQKSSPTFKEKLDLIIQLVEIIETTHLNNIIHRDLKPENIMINDGQVYIIDFGVSKIYYHTQTGTQNQKGTAAYFPPENCTVNTDKDAINIITISTKFDIWSIGCVACYLLTKQPPWSRKVVKREGGMVKGNSQDMSDIADIINGKSSLGNDEDNGADENIINNNNDNGQIFQEENDIPIINGGSDGELVNVITNGGVADTHYQDAQKGNTSSTTMTTTAINGGHAKVSSVIETDLQSMRLESLKLEKLIEKVEYKMSSEIHIVAYLTKKKPFKIPKEIPEELKIILSNCFEYDVAKRISATDLKNKLIAYYKSLS